MKTRKPKETTYEVCNKHLTIYLQNPESGILHLITYDRKVADKLDDFKINKSRIKLQTFNRKKKKYENAGWIYNLYVLKQPKKLQQVLNEYNLKLDINSIVNYVKRYHAWATKEIGEYYETAL